MKWNHKQLGLVRKCKSGIVLHFSSCQRSPWGQEDEQRGRLPSLKTLLTSFVHAEDVNQKMSHKQMVALKKCFGNYFKQLGIVVFFCKLNVNLLGTILSCGLIHTRFLSWSLLWHCSFISIWKYGYFTIRDALITIVNGWDQLVCDQYRSVLNALQTPSVI